MAAALGPVPEPRREARSVRQRPDQDGPIAAPDGRPVPAPTQLTRRASAHSLGAPAEASDTTEWVRRRAAGGDDPLGGLPVPEAIETVLRRRRGAGVPLADSVARELGAGFGADLTGVRVHADPEAAQLARRLQATAFTHGSDIYFGANAYQPETASGRYLLAHELAHVGQQRGSPAAPSGSHDVIGRADDPAERQADDLAARVVQRRAAHPPAA